MNNDGFYPEDQMQVEKVAIEAFLFAIDYGSEGVNHLISELKGLMERMDDYEREGEPDET